MLEGDEGKDIAKKLGPKKAIILHNHGLLTAASTIEAAVFWFVMLGELCQGTLATFAAVGGDLSRVVAVKDEFAAV